MFKDTVGRWFVRRMEEGESVSSFNCGDKYPDLNDFIANDAPQYRKELLAVTYLVEDNVKSVAYFSLANDRNGIGTTLMNYIKMYFMDDNKTGCRYITVDAHTDAIPFYLKNGFNFLQIDNKSTDTDSDSTHLMFFDLMSLKA